MTQWLNQNYESNIQNCRANFFEDNGESRIAVTSKLKEELQFEKDAVFFGWNISFSVVGISRFPWLEYLLFSDWNISFSFVGISRFLWLVYLLLS